MLVRLRPNEQRRSSLRYDARVHPKADDPRAEALRQNLRALRNRIESARTRGPHAADEVQLIAVTKSVEPDLFGPLAAAGVTDVGENRIQSAAQRKPLAPPGLTWHGIGHLQRNKAQTALETFDVFHALDSLRLARRLEELLAAQDRTWPVYLQINAAEDPAKSGVRPAEAAIFLESVLDLPHLRPIGYMTMGKLAAEKEELRSTFRTLREIRDEGLRLGRGRNPAQGLSMGMSDDFEMAVEEGATVIRIGRAIFRDVDSGVATAAPETRDSRRDGRASGELA